MKTNIYVDGYNLYNRAIKGTAYKWLDLRKLCEVLFPADHINKVRFFTAHVTPRPGDPNQLRRQQTYLRALETTAGFQKHLGMFRKRTITRPLVTPTGGVGEFVKVHTVEEKGSDVNLATYLLVDGYAGDFEQAIVISNDSDLALPIRMVRDVLHLPVGIVNPDNSNHTHTDLGNAATFIKRLRPNHLKQSQFPPTIIDAQGRNITKPSEWQT